MLHHYSANGAGIFSLVQVVLALSDVEDADINFNSININGPVDGSQIAAGSQINQRESIVINDFVELVRYIDTKLEGWQREASKPVLEALEDQVKRDSIRGSTLKRISEMISTWGPVAYPIVEAMEKLAGIKP